MDFRRFADTIPGCILVADADGNVLYANRAVIAALGRSLAELLGEGWLESVEPASLEEAKAKWYDCIRTAERLDVTWRFRIHDGTYRWQHLKAGPSRWGEKEGTRWCLLGVDVDERFRAQEALQASAREAREILDRVPAMISIRTVRRPMTSSTDFAGGTGSIAGFILARNRTSTKMAAYIAGTH